MKKVFIIIFALFLLIGSIFGLALYNLNSLIAAFKPTIEQSISTAIGSPIAFSSIEASGFPQLKIKLLGASIQGKSDITVPDLDLDVSLIPLLSNKIEVTSISVQNARLTYKSGDKEQSIDNLSAKASVELEGGRTLVKSISANATVLEKEEVSIKGENLSFEKDGVLNLGTTTLTTRGNLVLLSGTYDTKKSSSEIKVSAFSGAVTGDIGTKADAFDAKVSASGVQIQSLLRFVNPAGKETITGNITKASTELKGPTQGNVASGVSGPFRLALENGELKGINLGGKVLGAVKGIPLIEGALLSRVPEQYQKYFTSENTPIRTLNADGAIGGSNISLSKLVLVSDAFTLTSSGRITVGGSVDLSARIIFNKEVSQGIVGSIKELGKILNSDGTLEIPLEVQGIPPSLVVIPDVARLVELAAKGALKEKASEAIGKVLEKRGIGKETQKAIEGLFDF